MKKLSDVLGLQLDEDDFADSTSTESPSDGRVPVAVRSPAINIQIIAAMVGYFTKDSHNCQEYIRQYAKQINQ